jgi:hypothetical protein
MLSRLKARGLRICVWINPYIAQRSHLFDEGAAAGYLLRTTSGDVWQTDQWQAGMGLVDFTNPEAVIWYQSKLATLLDQGVDAFKTDFGERIPSDVSWFDGSDPERMHNYYTHLYNKAVRPARHREGRGRGGAVRPLGHGRRPAVPGALGRRLRLHLRVDGRDAARRAVAGDVRASATGATTSAASRGRPTRGLQALAAVRPAVQPLPAARVCVVQGAVGLRRGSGRHHPPLHAAEAVADAVHRASRRGGRVRRRPADAADGARVPTGAGATYRVWREGDVVVASTDDAPGAWTLEIVGGPSASASGASEVRVVVTQE